ncbi:MAG: M20/M25/M40 family metallo-hydrolase [Gemmatimonadota bacterium]
MRSTRVDSSYVYALVSALADDSMQGRRTGTPGSARAARWIAGEMSRIGLTPAGDSGFFQRVPLYEAQRTVGGQVRLAPALAPSFAALDTFPASQRLAGANLAGILRGSDPALAHEAVLVDAHYDHLGISTVADGDSIFNGADDDASGTVAVLEIARVMAAGPRPRRTVIFLATTGEEVGLLGTRWYIQHPVVSLDSTVANLEIEMIGRPDSLAGGRGRGWLTGYERSTMGEALAAAGIPLVADVRLDQNFFMRSDNIAFARLGIPAHTLSSYNMHTDYHRRSDEVSRLDAGHMALVIDAAARAVRLLADGPKPEWKPGGRPEPATPRR